VGQAFKRRGVSLPKVLPSKCFDNREDGTSSWNLSESNSMNERFRLVIEALEVKFQKLINMVPVRYSTLPRPLPERAIYLFSESDQHLYVGRTNGLRARLQGHCIPGATHNSATLAFRMARQTTGMHQAAYSTAGSRGSLVTDPSFGPAFVGAKLRVAKMDIRYVDEGDPVRQALLEIYTATALNTPYNDFENH